MTKLEQMLKQGPVLIPAVVCYPIKDDKVLLMHRVKASLGEGLYSGIGGKIGDEEAFANETADEALVREVQEEIGIIPTDYLNMGRVRFIWPSNPKANLDVTIYVINKWQGEPTITAVARPTWFNKSELPQNMWEDNHYWIPKVLAGKKIDAVFLYGDDNKVAEHVFY